MSFVSPSAPSSKEWSAEDFPSPSRMNRKTIFYGSDIEIGQINVKYPGMPVICSSASESSQFKPDTLYFRDKENKTWVAGGLRKHNHSTNDDADGGRLCEIVTANINNTFLLNYPDIHPTFFYQNNLGGTITEDYVNGRTVMNSGVLSGQYTTLRAAGQGISTGDLICFMIKMYIDRNTYLTTNIGPGMEHANAATDTLPKIGLSACDTINTPRFWEVLSCDGVSRTSQTALENVLQTSDRVYQLIHTPATSEQFLVNGVLNWTKSTNIPGPGGTFIAANNCFTMSTRTNSVAPVNTYLYSLVVAGCVGDLRWNI